MLSQTVFRTDDVPAADRMDAWQQCVGQTIAPLEVHVDPQGSSAHSGESFTAHQRLIRLDGVAVWPMASDPCRYVRNPRLIRRSDPEQYHLTLLLPGCGPLRTEHAGRRSVHRAHGLYLLDTSLPSNVTSSRSDGPVRAIGVEVPRLLLDPPRHGALASVLGRSLSAEVGFGGLLAQFLTSLDSDRSDYRPSDAPRLRTVLLDLLSGLIAHEVESEVGLPIEVRERNVEVRIRSYIHARLHDPELTVGSVAGAHHLSVRQLHRVFQHGDFTVSGYIRAQRLERARSLLADPGGSATPVRTVAALCGFSSLAHFSRLFRATYGVTPSEYRREGQDRTGRRSPGRAPEPPRADRTGATRAVRSKSVVPRPPTNRPDA
ncbi:AraC family transcriptional regulator [Streptomyces sp. NPDC005963]|uniref:helix-turn-helix transcriptional regulator n=1 Tax=Streptomyces sp. NPDC005963 TaxID=3156721 RepID=UPI0033E7E8AE